jgi:hypothetical protein
MFQHPSLTKITNAITNTQPFPLITLSGASYMYSATNPHSTTPPLYLPSCYIHITDHAPRLSSSVVLTLSNPVALLKSTPPKSRIESLIRAPRGLAITSDPVESCDAVFSPGMVGDVGFRAPKWIALGNFCRQPHQLQVIRPRRVAV